MARHLICGQCMRCFSAAGPSCVCITRSQQEYILYAFPRPAAKKIGRVGGRSRDIYTPHRMRIIKQRHPSYRQCTVYLYIPIKVSIQPNLNCVCLVTETAQPHRQQMLCQMVKGIRCREVTQRGTNAFKCIGCHNPNFVALAFVCGKHGRNISRIVVSRRRSACRSPIFSADFPILHRICCGVFGRKRSNGP